jgi:hypothetical protein
MTIDNSLDSEQLLNQLTGATEQAVGQLEAREREAVDLEARFLELESQMDDAAKIRDERERDLRVKVLTADLQELRSDAEKEAEDLAQAVFGLNAMLESMGTEYAKLNQFNGEETGLIERNKERLEQATKDLESAQNRRFFRNRALADAKSEMQFAEQALKDATAEARRKARQRLLKADMEASLQEFMLRVERTIAIMERRKAVIEGQLQAVTNKKEHAFQIKEQAARALEQLDQELTGSEEQLRIEEEQMQALQNGTSEHAEQSNKVSTLRAQVEDLRGRRNTALVLFQSKEKFAAELEVHERTQMKLRDNQRMWITALRSDTEERVVTFRSRLEAMKAMADQDIAKQLDELGADTDQRNVEYMARAGAVSDELRMKRMEMHPQRVADIQAARAAQAEAIQRIRQRERKMIEQFKEQYGLDPTSSSFFTYDGAANGDSTGSEETF